MSGETTEVSALDAIGCEVVLTIAGELRQDHVGLYIDAPGGPWRLTADDRVRVPLQRRTASS